MTEALRRLFIVSNTLSRILQRDKPKAQIVESQVKKFFKETNAEEAVITIRRTETLEPAYKIICIGLLLNR